VRVFIRDNETGEEAEYEDRRMDWNFDDGIGEFMFLEANWSCDCHRHVFHTGIYEDFPCGETRYTITKVIDTNGDIIDNPEKTSKKK